MVMGTHHIRYNDRENCIPVVALTSHQPVYVGA